MNVLLRRRSSLSGVLSLLTSLIAGAAMAADTPKLVTEEFMVPAVDPGIQIYVRNKRPENLRNFGPDNIVLFVHGATTPAETGFDLKLDGVSWMETIAARGYDTYFVNVRGYGKSTRPPEMDQPPQNNGPIVRTDVAARDVGAAVDFIRKRRGVAKINLIGHSWGTRIMSMYTIGNNDKVNKLVLFAPGWIRQSASLTDPGGKLGAYRVVDLEAVKKRRNTGLPEGMKHSDLMPEAWFNTWAEAAFASDPWGNQQNPKVLRAPTGSQADTRDYWSNGGSNSGSNSGSGGKAQYDPAGIRVPTLLILAEWDADTPPYMAQALFPKLVNSPNKRLVIIGEGTHIVFTEKNRMHLFRQVQSFLDEKF